MVFNKDNKKEISAIEDLIKAKVYVNPTRFEELSKLKEDIWSQTPDVTEEPYTLLCFNLSPQIEDQLRSLKGYTLQVEQITEDKADPTHKEDRKRFLKVFGGKRLEEGRVAAIIHELRSEDDQLSLLDRRVIALSLLSKLPVVSLATRCPDPLPAASAASGDTWPVFFVPHPHQDMRPVLQWLAEELPRVRALSGRIEADLQARVAHLGRVSAPLHFMSRASVALVPFGVMTVNFLGILRLMANMLQCVGMRGDTSANKALGLLGAKNAALVTAVDSMGDVYSFGVFATVLADLQGLGLVEAAAAMDVVDGLMLGSISVVTGAVSALGAYLSRPLVVRAAAEFLASLQTIHVLNPTMRREHERREKAGGKKKKGGRKGSRWRKEGEAEAEELRGLLQRSARKSGLRRPGGGSGGGDGRAVEEMEAAAAAAVAGLREEEQEREEEADADAGTSLREHGHDDDAEGCTSTSASDEESDEDGADSEEEGEERSSGELGQQQASQAAASGASGRPGGAGDSGSGEGTGGSSAAADAAVVAARDGGGSGEVHDAGTTGDAVSAPNTELSRSGKKQQALADRQSAREAKAAVAAAKAEAKAAAKAERKAAMMEERERKRQEKQQQREQRAAAKAAAKAAKARGPDPLAVQVGGTGGDGDVPSAEAASGAAEGPAVRGDAIAASVKTPWWRRRKAGDVTAAAAGEARKSEEGDQGELGGAGRASRHGTRSSSDGSCNGSAAEGADSEEGEGEEDALRKARLGLDEETCRGLMSFLNLPDEVVYDDAAAQPDFIG